MWSWQQVHLLPHSWWQNVFRTGWVVRTYWITGILIAPTRTCTAGFEDLSFAKRPGCWRVVPQPRSSLRPGRQGFQPTFGVASKLHVITNGYDPDELARVQPHRFDHFAIVYSGNFYPPKRVISPLMAALNELQNLEASWAFHHYGLQGDHVLQEARRFGLQNRVVIHGAVPRNEALSAGTRRRPGRSDYVSE